MQRRWAKVIVGALVVGASGVLGGRARADLVDMPPLSAKTQAEIRQAWIAYRAGDLLGVPAHINAALQSARDAHDTASEAGVLLIKATLSRQVGREARAKELESEAEPLLRAMPLRQRLAIYFGAALGLREAGLSAGGLAWIERAEAEANAARDGREQAQALHLRGLFATDPAQAQAYYEQAVGKWRACGEAGGLAWSLMRLGKLRDNGNSAQALRLLREADEAAQRSSSKSVQARTAYELMLFYHGSGDLAQARALGERALRAAQAPADPLGEMQRSLILQQLTVVLAQLGDYNRVALYGEEARRLAHEAGRPRSELAVVNCLMAARVFQGRNDLAVRDANAALGLVSGAPRAQEEPGSAWWQCANDARATASDVFWRVGERERALSLADALPEASRWAATKAIAAEARGDLEGAAKGWTQALDDVEAQRTQLSALTNSKISLVAKYKSQYSRLVDILLRQGKTEEAFTWLEKARGRGLLDLIEGGRATSNRTLSPAQRARRAALQERVARADRQLLALQMGEGSDDELRRARAESSQAVLALNAFQDSLTANSPALAASGRPLTTGELGRALPRDTALVEYALLDDPGIPAPVHRVVAFIARSDGGSATVSAIPLPVSRDDLSEMANDFAAACADPSRSYKSKSRQLDRLLLQPLQKAIGDAKRLVLCPDGVLWNVPFAALLDARNRFAIQRFELVLGYSASTALRLQASPLRSPRPHLASLLVVANPDFGGPQRLRATIGTANRLSAETRSLLAHSRDTLSHARALLANSRGLGNNRRSWLSRAGVIEPLPGTAREARAIAHEFPTARLLEGRAANEDTVTRTIGNFRWVHFATHGVLNDADPLGSSIVLAAPAPRSTKDGFLSARKILDLDLHADLVVLSACNTGGGQKRDGEGVLGLTWALGAAGAKAQIVSGWSVNDDSTARLMELFYARLKKGEGRGAALRHAMLQFQSQSGPSAKPARAPSSQSKQHRGVIVFYDDGTQPFERDSQRPFSHPYYWAPFFLLGDWR